MGELGSSSQGRRCGSNAASGACTDGVEARPGLGRGNALLPTRETALDAPVSLVAAPDGPRCPGSTIEPSSPASVSAAARMARARRSTWQSGSTATGVAAAVTTAALRRATGSAADAGAASLSGRGRRPCAPPPLAAAGRVCRGRDDAADAATFARAGGLGLTRPSEGALRPLRPSSIACCRARICATSAPTPCRCAPTASVMLILGASSSSSACGSSPTRLDSSPAPLIGGADCAGAS